MSERFFFGFLPYLAALSCLLVPVGRGLYASSSPVISMAPSRGARLLRWSVALVLAVHAVAFVVPQAIAVWRRVALGTQTIEALGLGMSLIALWTLLTTWRERRRTPIDHLVLLLLLLTVGSGIWTAVALRWGSVWYAETVLPYVDSLVRLEPETALVNALPLAPRLHLAAGWMALFVLPWSSAGALLARPWSVLRQRPRALRRALAGAAVVAMAAVGFVVVDALAHLGRSDGYAPEQPLAFSHALHAGTNRIPCLYCHFAAERSRHAGIPAASVCMNCHGQLRIATAEIAKLKEAVAQARPIQWVKVHNLPDFVAFNHSQHVKVAGLACQRCHGPVETMDRVRQEAPLTMGWCIDCHRSEGVVPPDQRAPQLVAGADHVRSTGGLDCAHCHY